MCHTRRAMHDLIHSYGNAYCAYNVTLCFMYTCIHGYLVDSVCVSQCHLYSSQMYQMINKLKLCNSGMKPLSLCSGMIQHM